MGTLDRDTAVEGGDGTYTATPNQDWEIWGPMGGYAASIALRAAAREVAEPLRPASLSCQFLAPARFEPVDMEVVVRRATRRTAAVSVRMDQDGAPILDLQAWFALESDAIVHDHAVRHPHGDPDDHPSVTDLSDEPSPFPFWGNLDGRVVSWIEDWETYPGGEPAWAEWLRFVPVGTFDDPLLEACRLLVMADLPSFPAATRAHPGGRPLTWIAPNLDLGVQFHHLDGLGEWLLATGTAPVAHRGLIGFRSEVWTRDGRLAASGSGQLLTRVMRPEQAPRTGGA